VKRIGASSRQHLRQSALAGPIVADDRENFPCAQLEVDAVERDDMAVALRYPTRLEDDPVVDLDHDIRASRES
jgi:hypothetical protein